MKRVYRIDPEGFYVEDVIIEDGSPLPSDCVEMREPVGFYKIKYDRSTGYWVEGLSQSEIDELLNQPTSKSETDILKERLSLSEEAIDFILMDGGLQ